MTFDPNIPQSNETPRDSVTPIRGNFTQYQSVFGINHVGFNDANQGKHTYTLMKKQATDPDVTGDWSTLYVKDATSAAPFGTQPELFVRIPQFLPNEVPNTPMRLTYPQVVTAPAGTDPYQSFLPGGYVLYANTLAAFGGGPATSQQFTVTPTPSELIAVFVQAKFVTAEGVTVTIQQPDKFTIYRDTGMSTADYNYIAIGRA